MKLIETDIAKIPGIVARQHAYFATGATLSLEFRLAQLKKLYKLFESNEKQILEAVYKDFKKPAFEVYGSEVALVQHEIKYFLRHLPRLMRPERLKSALVLFPSKSYLYHEPHGVSLIIGPWNYPFMLQLMPVVGALAAGNCVVMKPSELTEHTSALIARMMAEAFGEEYVAVVQGGPVQAQALLNLKFDHIFFTGSPKVGKIVYEAAAKHLTPVVLELGGKSPCIVDQDAEIDGAARRIVFGKLFNNGQTCVAPDYLLVHKSIKNPLIQRIAHYIDKHYNGNPKASPDLTRIINERNFDRLAAYLNCGKIVLGGETDRADRYIAPTLLDEVSWDDPVMQEEIFGPILPVMTFEDLDDALMQIKSRPRPLALYYFSKNARNQDKIMHSVSFGGGCINDTLLHFGSTWVPIGGVGDSGHGLYHGRESFKTFSNSKGIVKKGYRFDIPFRYPPYEGKMGLLKLIFRF